MLTPFLKRLAISSPRTPTTAQNLEEAALKLLADHQSVQASAEKKAQAAKEQRDAVLAERRAARTAARKEAALAADPDAVRTLRSQIDTWFATMPKTLSDERTTQIRQLKVAIRDFHVANTAHATRTYNELQTRWTQADFIAAMPTSALPRAPKELTQLLTLELPAQAKDNEQIDHLNELHQATIEYANSLTDHYNQFVEAFNCAITTQTRHEDALASEKKALLMVQVEQCKAGILRRNPHLELSGTRILLYGDSKISLTLDTFQDTMAKQNPPIPLEEQARVLGIIVAKQIDEWEDLSHNTTLLIAQKERLLAANHAECKGVATLNIPCKDAKTVACTIDNFQVLSTEHKWSISNQVSYFTQLVDLQLQVWLKNAHQAPSPTRLAGPVPTPLPPIVSSKAAPTTTSIATQTEYPTPDSSPAAPAAQEPTLAPPPERTLSPKSSMCTIS